MRTYWPYVFLFLAACGGVTIPQGEVDDVAKTISNVGHPLAEYRGGSIVSAGPMGCGAGSNHVDIEVKYKPALKKEEQTMRVRINVLSLDPCEVRSEVLEDTGPDPFLLDNDVASKAIGKQVCKALGAEWNPMSDIRYACFELRTTCDACGQPVPLNGPWRSFTCSYCFEKVALPEERIADLLKDFEEDSPGLDPREGSGGTLMSERTYKYGYWLLPPRCQECKKPLPEVETGPEGVLACAKCGVEVETRPVEDWLKKAVPSAVQVIGACAPDGVPEKATGEMSDRVVALACPACGGGLKITSERERIAPCQYCEVEVYLPDAVWKRLHPVEKVHEWFVRFEGRTAKQLEQDRRERDRVAEEADLARRDGSAVARKTMSWWEINKAWAVFHAVAFVLWAMVAGVMVGVGVFLQIDSDTLGGVSGASGILALFTAMGAWQPINGRDVRASHRALMAFAESSGLAIPYEGSTRIEGKLDGYTVTVDPEDEWAIEVELKKAEDDWFLHTEHDDEPDDEMLRITTGETVFDDFFPIRYATPKLAERFETSSADAEPIVAFLERWGDRLLRFRVTWGEIACHMRDGGSDAGDTTRYLPPDSIEPLTRDLVALAALLDAQATSRRT